MVGITGFGAYIPYGRLQRSRIQEAMGIPAAPGEKAVANFDEDSVSLGASAVLDCLSGSGAPGGVDILYFATTTGPYKEKQVATIVAGAADLPGNIRTADFTSSLRSGSAAMLAAIDAASSGTGQAVASAADCRLGGAAGQNEQIFGDGAAAFCFGKEKVLAAVEGSFSAAGEIIDNWRIDGDKFVRNWEERFGIAEGYNRMVRKAVGGLLEKVGLTPQDISKLVLYAPSPRYQMAAAQAMGFGKEQVQDSLIDNVGCAGAANAPMMLAAALEASQPGDRLLMVTYGEGSDAILFQVTDNIKGFSPEKGVSGYLDSKRSDVDYQTYLKWKKMIPLEPARRPDPKRPSSPAMWRKYKQNLPLYGTRCTACGTPQFPMQRVCINCSARDQMERYKFSDKKATVTTYTVDNLAVSPDPPTIIAVIDFEGGGRRICEMVDADVNKLEIGMQVEMCFRFLYESGGIYNYFWKARPKR